MEICSTLRIKLTDKLETAKFTFDDNTEVEPFRGIAVGEYIAFTKTSRFFYQRASLTNYDLTDYTALTIEDAFTHYSDMNAGNTVATKYYKILDTRQIYYVVSSGVFTQVIMADVS